MEVKPMDITPITLADINQMTLKVGEEWAINHTKRLIELIKHIGANMPYDAYIIELAAYLHDWGACPTYLQKGIEHAIRSRQVVEAEIVPYLDLTSAQKTTLLETIELHDYRDLRSTQTN
jgi:HD superfamily phosphodiesterase